LLFVHQTFLFQHLVYATYFDINTNLKKCAKILCKQLLANVQSLIFICN
jgi:hypothetical protein